MEYTIVVAEMADSPATLQYLAPYTGAALAEYFMYRDHPHRIGAAAAKKRSNRSSGDGRDGEAQDLRGAGAGRRRILPHRRLWYPFFPSHGFRANPSASAL